MRLFFYLLIQRLFWCKDTYFFIIASDFYKILKTNSYLFAFMQIFCTFAPQKRDIAQLVARHVRDVEAGRSSRPISTKFSQFISIQTDKEVFGGR